MKKVAGFSLVELLITIVLLGVILSVVSPLIGKAFDYFAAANRTSNVLNNQKIAGALLSYARSDGNGELPAPYTGNGIFSGVFNPTDTSVSGEALIMELRSTGIPVGFINNDSTAVQNVKTYQRLTGLTYDTPIYGNTGTEVTITYSVGAIVQTRCAKASSCNTAVPGDSEKLTASNISTWSESGDDYGGVVISTLLEQKSMLRATVGRINRLADRLSTEFYTRQRISAANSTTNFFPLPSNGGAPSLSGRNPVTNMGCHNGWYDLSANNVNVLAQIGLDQGEYGLTAWKGVIEYCQDNEPTATGTTTANKPPHYAALRINKSVSTGAAPTNVIGNNVVITF